MKSGRRVWWAALCAAVMCALFVQGASADMFGTGANEFTIDFVPISKATNPTQQQADADGAGYGIVNYDYRIGVYEINNDQWNKFVTLHGNPTGNPWRAYGDDPYWTGLNVPTNCASWYEAAQFVNWLNTSTGHQAAYKFTSNNYPGVWDAADAWGGTNLYRHKAAYYFLPDEHEWVKAAYWNGAELQTYATKNDAVPVAGTDSNYAQSWPYAGPWNVGSGSKELNGTYDMMGNVWEWMESPWTSGNYTARALRGLSAGSYTSGEYALRASYRFGPYYYPDSQFGNVGFRVASIPEPASATMLLMGAVAALLWRRRRTA